MKQFKTQVIQALVPRLPKEKNKKKTTACTELFH